jgi:YVTN family beta-propeller protein
VKLTKDGRLAFTTNMKANTVSVIDAVKKAVVATVKVGNGPGGLAILEQ